MWLVIQDFGDYQLKASPDSFCQKDQKKLAYIFEEWIHYRHTRCLLGELQTDQRQKEAEAAVLLGVTGAAQSAGAEQGRGLSCMQQAAVLQQGMLSVDNKPAKNPLVRHSSMA